MFYLVNQRKKIFDMRVLKNKESVLKAIKSTLKRIIQYGV